MIPGFENIVEDRIKTAQKKGLFDNLVPAGKPLKFNDDRHIPEDLRLAYKILKNADFLPPEIEARKQILQTQELLAETEDTATKYRLLNKLNCLIMKVNAARKGNIRFEIPQCYMSSVVNRFSSGTQSKKRPKDSLQKKSNPNQKAKIL
ncbi:MAG: DUF1992 domain-containing protein [Desulfobacteraceae bacterium]|nr:DUF1992 domain-containing protein [Desulfobacteraceae bacterium]